MKLLSLVAFGLIIGIAIVLLLGNRNARQFENVTSAASEAKTRDQRLESQLRESSNPRHVDRARMSPVELDRSATQAAELSTPDIEGFDTVVFQPDGTVADEATTAAAIRSEAADEIRAIYTRLLDELSITSEQKEAVLNLLIENRIAITQSPYKHGQPIDSTALSQAIASVIGEQTLLEFRSLEANLGAYTELEQLGSLLKSRGVPLSADQQDDLLQIIVETFDNHKKALADEPPGPPSIASIERQVAQLADYERHLVELAPSVLTPQQVVVLDTQYQYLAYQRANAIEMQRNHAPDHITTTTSTLWFPRWTNIGN